MPASKSDLGSQKQEQKPRCAERDTAVALRTRSKRKRNLTSPELENSTGPSRAVQKMSHPTFSPPNLPIEPEEISKPNDVAPHQECGICLEPVKNRGLLDSCSHLFCFACIMKWTKRCSSCPHCKREVNHVAKTDVKGENSVSSHQVKKRTLRDTLDREEFQQRRRQFSGNRRRVVGEINVPFPDGAVFESLSSRARAHALNTDLTEHLLSMQQMLRDNMTRFSASLRGLQDNLNLAMFPQQPPFPLMSFCNFPGIATNINVTVNGIQQGEPFQSSMLPGYQNMNTNIPFHQFDQGERPQMTQFNGSFHHAQLNGVFLPFPVFHNGPGIGPMVFPEMAQTIQDLSALGQMQIQQILAQNQAHNVTPSSHAHFQRRSPSPRHGDRNGQSFNPHL